MKKKDEEMRSMKKSIAKIYGDKEYLIGPGGLRESISSGGHKKQTSKPSLIPATVDDSGKVRAVLINNK